MQLQDSSLHGSKDIGDKKSLTHRQKDRQAERNITPQLLK